MKITIKVKSEHDVASDWTIIFFCLSPDLGNYSKKRVMVVEPVVIIGPNCGQEIEDFKSITLIENFSILKAGSTMPNEFPRIFILTYGYRLF